MATSLPATQRMREAYLYFMLKRTEGQFQETEAERELDYHSTKALLGEREPEIILPLELDGDVWTLLVVDDGVELHRVDNDGAAMRFLGKLRGDYVETLRLVVGGDELQWTFRLMDERLPGGVLELTLSQPQRPRVYQDPDAGPRRDEIEKLSKKLREWASSTD